MAEAILVMAVEAVMVAVVSVLSSVQHGSVSGRFLTVLTAVMRRERRQLYRWQKPATNWQHVTNTAAKHDTR